MKLLLIAGHGDGDPGACALGHREADLTRELAQLLRQALAAYNVEAEQFDPAKNAYTYLKSNSFDFRPYDYVLELHFNAGAGDTKGNGKTTGAEILVRRDERAVGVETAMLAKLEALGLKNRGVKRRNDLLVMNRVKAQGVSPALLEVCFMDDKDDMKLYQAKKQAAAEAIVAGIAAGFRLTKKQAGIAWLQQCGAYRDKIQRIAHIPMDGERGETVSHAARRVRWNGKPPDILCNAELFDMHTYKPVSGIVEGGAATRLTDTLGAAFVNQKQVVLSYRNNVNADDWVGAYPMLVRDGKLAFTRTPAGLGGNVARTALCWNDTVVAVCYVKAEQGKTLEEFADAIRQRGFTHAINLDGGGSTACISPAVKYDQGRPVRGMIGIWYGAGGNKLAR